MASPEEKNIVIVGGGIIGCTSAYFLTRHPAYDASKHRIILLEATTLAGGASGKAGGLLALWAYPSSLVPLSYKLHQQLADEHGGADRWGYRAVHCGQVDCVGRKLPDRQTASLSVEGKDGAMTGDRHGGESVSLQKRSRDALAALRAAGVPPDLDWLAPESLRAYDAMGDPQTTAQVHPYHFTRAMAELAREKGAEVREGSAVTELVYSADGQGVEGVRVREREREGGSADGTGPGADGESSSTTTTTTTTTFLPATDVILAAGPWTRAVYPDAPIDALRAHSVTIRPRREVSAYALFTQIRLPEEGGGAHAGQVVTPEIYARPRNEVYACGEGDHLVPLPASTDAVAVDEARCQDIVDFVASVSDELRDGEVTARQACYLPSVSGSSAPLVGLTHIRGLILAAGHTCWGIQNGPGTGKLVSEFVFDGRAKSAKVKGLDPRNYL